jgi:hypothetical protein
MSQSLPPWSLHWRSDGELSPMDRDDLPHRAPPKIYYFPIVKP